MKLLSSNQPIADAEVQTFQENNMQLRLIGVRSAALLLPALALASSGVNAPSETGAFTFYSGAGWSFGFPSVQAIVSVPGGPTAVSPLKKTLPNYHVGADIRAWKFLVPFVDFSVIDTGKATAQVGSYESQGSANTFLSNSGVRFMGRASRLRPYAEVGGGLLHQGLKASFIANGQSYPASASGSTSDIMYGGGVRMFWAKRWGSDISFDGYHATQTLSGAGQNFSAVRFSLFFQTKSSVQ